MTDLLLATTQVLLFPLSLRGCRSFGKQTVHTSHFQIRIWERCLGLEPIPRLNPVLLDVRSGVVFVSVPIVQVEN